MSRLKSRTIGDLVVLSGFAGLALALAITFDAFERITAWSLVMETRYEMFELDELLVVSFVLAVAFGVFSWRRWRDLEREVAERKRLQEILEHQAFHDSLTGLPNRLLFQERLGHALACGEGLVAVLLLDLDNFKVVNDSLGHEAGDELLVGVGRRLRTCLRPQDTLARLGGDELAVLLEDADDAWGAVRVAERIEDELRKAPFDLSGREVFVSASLGVALGSSSDEAWPEDLLRSADLAMYRAKRKGRACHEVFEEAMNREVRERLELETDLRRAVERGEEEFILYYQPVVSLETGRIAGMESLLRWEHPERGTLGPDEFVPLAEETGLIVPLGRWVLREACRQACEWHVERPAGQNPVIVGVNLSMRQFQDPGLVGDVARVLDETGLDPELLALEVTESVAMRDPDSTAATLEELKSLGVWLVVDDFGTGNGSLSYLTRRFKMDHLKLDGSFVREYVEDPENAAIVPGLISMAHALGLRVIAEGVETESQLERLRMMGCEFVQGYYFARPLEGDSVRALLDAETSLDERLR